jgi:prepilin-type N-terminal cleavage/methylation domain-containing protein
MALLVVTHQEFFTINKLVYYEVHNEVTAAYTRESQIKNMNQKPAKINQKAFSLIELSIVILIISVFMASFINLLGSINSTDKYAETKAKMERVADAIIKYRNKNGVLPVPARIDLLPDDQMYGYFIENSDQQNAYAPDNMQEYLNGKMLYGMVPFVNLGLNEEDAYDAWGNRISFIADAYRLGGSKATRSSFKIFDKSNEAIVKRMPTKTEVEAGQSSKTCGDGTDSVTSYNQIIYPCAAFVLISHGINGDGAFNAAGVQDVIAGKNIEGKNAFNNISPTMVYSLPLNTNKNTADIEDYFDDIIVYRTADYTLNVASNSSGSGGSTSVTYSNLYFGDGEGSSASACEKLANITHVCTQQGSFIRITSYSCSARTIVLETALPEGNDSTYTSPDGVNCEFNPKIYWSGFIL